MAPGCLLLHSLALSELDISKKESDILFLNQTFPYNVKISIMIF